MQKMSMTVKSNIETFGGGKFYIVILIFTVSTLSRLNGVAHGLK